MIGKNESIEGGDIEDYIRYMDKKTIWKDQLTKEEDTLANGGQITPIYSLTSSHFWIKRNLIPISDGTNIILSNFKDNSQKIIPLKTDCIVTSLYFSISSTNERLIIVGEKIHPPYSNEHLFRIAPRVEIINLDNKIIDERRNLDHTFYSNSDSYIYDAIIPNNSDICYSLVKSNDMNEIETKVFVWEYIPLTLKTIFNFDGHIEAIIPDPKNATNLIFYNLYYIGIYQYQQGKKKIILLTSKEEEREFCDVTYLKNENNSNKNNFILVSLKNHFIEVLDKELNIVNSINLQILYKQTVKLNEISSIDNDTIEEEILQKKNNNKKLNTFILDSSHPIIYIISRGNLLFVFFDNTCYFFIIKINEKEEFLFHSIESFKRNVTEKSSFMINSSATKIISIFGNYRSNINKNFHTKLKYKMTKRKVLNTKIGAESFSYKKEKNENVVPHELEKRKIFYSLYTVDINKNLLDDSFYELEMQKNDIFSHKGIYVKFDCDFLINSAMGIDLKSISLSINPRIILSTFKSNELVINQQIDKIKYQVNNHTSELDMKNSLSHDDHKSSRHIEKTLLEINSNNNFKDGYIEQESRLTDINFLNSMSKELEYEPVSISINPYGSYFFLAFEDSAYIYGVLDNELKEFYKISSSCQGATFSNTGKYLAFSNSEFVKDEYNIIILDARTMEIEYLITNLNGHATKIIWMDSDEILVALIDEKDIYGWRLNENRVISNTKDKIESSKGKKNETNIILKLIEYGEKLIDFCYDHVIDYLLLIGEDLRVKIFKANSENGDHSWEFPIDCKYTSTLLIRKLDIIVFGTNEGAIRICIWPISNFTKKDQVDHPSFTEKFLHGMKVIQLIVSKDLKYLYSCSSNGSVYISLLNSFCNDSKIDLQTFVYFDPKNLINKKVYSKYSDYLQLTDQIYKNKSNVINKLEFDIQGINVEFNSEIEKLNGENSKNLTDKKYFINNIIEKERTKVKNIDEEKDILTKHLRDKRENQIKFFKEDLKKIKKSYKLEKESLQNTTKNLSNVIKDLKLNYNNYLEIIDNKKKSNENKLKSLLDEVNKNLSNRLLQIKKVIESKEEIFRAKINELEDTRENILKDEEHSKKYKNDVNNRRIQDLTNEIDKISKDNQNYKERIGEWEKNLKELRENNAELMESFLFNTLKLKQMNKSLLDNESKISDREVIVKDKRLINERLEKLRFVLEYQIKNLIKERIPIEEQIKNFEELHSDFYQRFNLLYAEQLNIEEFINNNFSLIENFKDELASRKNNLYCLKNILRALDTEINFIFKNNMDDKNLILNQLEIIYKKYLQNYFDKDTLSIYAQETKLQSRLMIKEIKVQKNKVLKDLSKKRKDIDSIKNQKEYLMLKIQGENNLLIEESSSIRMNLEDILKYINDIEKKFIELTNTHVLLGNNPMAKNIKINIRKAKDKIGESDVNKGKVAREGEKNGKMNNKANKTMYDAGKKKNIFGLKNNLSNMNRTNINEFRSAKLINQIDRNKNEIINQERQITKINQKIKDIIGIDLNDPESLNNTGKINGSNSRVNIDADERNKLDNSSTIKSKYVD